MTDRDLMQQALEDRMNEMWSTLAEYQPYADKHGFGPAWAEMCSQRTAAAAKAAFWAAADKAAYIAANAADLAYIAEAKAVDAADAADYAKRAIEAAHGIGEKT
jgi:hypothetical protein